MRKREREGGEGRYNVVSRRSFNFRCRDKSDGLFNLATRCHSFRARAPLSLRSAGPLTLRLILSQLSPFRGGDGGGGGANGADRNSNGLGRKAIERRFRRAVARDRARRGG